MKKLKQQNAITLIALVITIIILLILAGISIQAITNTGLFEKTENAKQKTEIAQEKEAIELARYGVLVENKGEGITATELQMELRKNGYPNATALDNGDETITVTFETGNSYIINSNENKKRENIKEYTSDGVPIPQGFYYVGGTKEEGVVISDSSKDENKGVTYEVDATLIGNQFVWIPVQDFNNFVRKAGYENGNLQNCVFESEEPKESIYYEESSNGEKNETETDKMYNSVKENKGFFIGRYETGIEGEEARTQNSGMNDKAVIKKDKRLYNYLDWEQSVTVAAEFAKNNEYDNVTSTLCYGVQWDATMSFIDNKYMYGNCEDESYVKNSEDRGNYINYGDYLVKTGTNENYIVKNIYDLAGNAEEWTMERYGESGYVGRGGPYLSFSSDGFNHPASWRDCLDKSFTSSQSGFRVTLFIN